VDRDTGKSAAPKPPSGGSGLHLGRVEAYTHAINNHLTIIVGDCDVAASTVLSAHEVSFRFSRIRGAALAIGELTTRVAAL
jgi:hypothetical protein